MFINTWGCSGDSLVLGIESQDLTCLSKCSTLWTIFQVHSYIIQLINMISGLCILIYLCFCVTHLEIQWFLKVIPNSAFRISSWPYSWNQIGWISQVPYLLFGTVLWFIEQSLPGTFFLVFILNLVHISR